MGMATLIPLPSVPSLHDQALNARQPLTTTAYAHIGATPSLYLCCTLSYSLYGQVGRIVSKFHGVLHVGVDLVGARE